MSEIESDRQSESAYEPGSDSESELKEEFVELMECKEQEKDEKPKRLFKV